LNAKKHCAYVRKRAISKFHWFTFAIYTIKMVDIFVTIQLVKIQSDIVSVKLFNI